MVEEKTGLSENAKKLRGEVRALSDALVGNDYLEAWVAAGKLNNTLKAVKEEKDSGVLGVVLDGISTNLRVYYKHNAIVQESNKKMYGCGKKLEEYLSLMK